MRFRLFYAVIFNLFYLILSIQQSVNKFCTAHLCSAMILEIIFILINDNGMMTITFLPMVHYTNRTRSNPSLENIQTVVYWGKLSQRIPFSAYNNIIPPITLIHVRCIVFLSAPGQV